MRRHKLARRTSKKMFSKTAKHVHGKNMMPTPMRGGFRI